MKKKAVSVIIVLMLVVFNIIHVNGQKCSEDPFTKKGVWKKDPDKNYNEPTVHPETKKNKTAISAELDSIAALFIRSNPEPVGSFAKWYKYFDSENDSLTCPDPSFTNYQFISLLLPYVCDKGVVKPFSLTDTWIYVHVNGYWCSGHIIQHEMNDALGEKLFTLPPQRGTLDGYPVFEPIPKGEKDNPWLMFYSVLVHQPGKLPYTPVTKSEFFELNRKLIDKKEIEYKAGIEYQRKNMGEDWYTERADQIKKQFQGMRDNLEQLEKLYEKELSQPAILRQWEWDLRGIEIANPTQKTLFTAANRGYQLVRANPDYMDHLQAKWKPQYMWVEWFKPLAKPNALELDKVMHDQFDFRELGKLLTK